MNDFDCPYDCLSQQILLPYISCRYDHHTTSTLLARSSYSSRPFSDPVQKAFFQVISILNKNFWAQTIQLIAQIKALTQHISWPHVDVMDITDISQIFIAYNMDNTWISLGDHLVTTWWPSLGDHLVTTWWPPGDHLATTWRPQNYHLVTTWWPLGYHLVPLRYPWEPYWYP